MNFLLGLAFLEARWLGIPLVCMIMIWFKK